MLNVRSVADLNRTIVRNLHRIDRSSFDVIVGIPRSGMIPASLLATHLQMPLADVMGFSKGYAFERSGRTVSAVPRVLLVDDSANKGRAMTNAAQAVGRSASSIIRLAIYGPYQTDEKVVDISLEHCQGPRAFQWNLAKHIRLPRWGFDFDGVFCRDPLKSENDDGPAYEKFLAEAEPLFLPTREIGHIVTCRLERYRKPTEAWLRRHNVTFSGLHMMPYANKAERMAAGGRGQWKAETIKRLGVEFFIESDPKQASIIARLTGLPVWCMSTQALA